MENETNTKNENIIDNPEVLAFTLGTKVNRMYDDLTSIILMFSGKVLPGSFDTKDSGHSVFLGGSRLLSLECCKRRV